MSFPETTLTATTMVVHEYLGNAGTALTITPLVIDAQACNVL
jgi:hypothetical protein